MRVSASFTLQFVLGAAPLAADTLGACMIETPAGEAINIGSCVQGAPACAGNSCEVGYAWQADRFTTYISGGPGGAVRDGTAMNGQEAYAPAALVDSDPRDCIYNDVSSAVFCWVPGAEAHALAVNGAASRDALIALAAGAAPPPSTGGRKAQRPILRPTDETAADKTAVLLAPMQGKYRAHASWTCDEIGMDGGATAIIGTQLRGVETTCTLSGGQAVGRHGAALFDAACTGEGEVWTDEIVLKRGSFGGLALLWSDAVAIWQACD